MFKRKFLSLITVMLLILSMTATCFAGEKNFNVSTYKEFKAQYNPNAKIKFIDESLKNSSVKTRGVITEVYDHSYYTVGEKDLREVDCDTYQNKKFLISVARGSTKTLSSSKSVSGTVSVSGSTEIKSVIKLSLTGSVSGTVSKTWNRGETFSGPSESSSCNTRYFYGCVNYDLYNIEVKKWDVYRIYNGNIDTGKTTTVYGGNEYVDNVKSPKCIEYSIDKNVN
ncbi:MAG: hypothetical protein N4A68_03695 [Maledivibacter sp.]|jgi:hypothetical protein|nr:hypothetical protein [Maledivibacter sp.]